MCPRRPSVPCLEEGQRLRGPLGRSRFVLGSWEKGLRFRAFRARFRFFRDRRSCLQACSKRGFRGKRLRVARLLPGFEEFQCPGLRVFLPGFRDCSRVGLGFFPFNIGVGRITKIIPKLSLSE